MMGGRVKDGSSGNGLLVGGVEWIRAITVVNQAVANARVSQHAPFTNSLRGPQSGWVVQGEVGL